MPPLLAGTDSKIGFFPWLGVTTSYTPETNPFQKQAVKDFTINYYKALMGVLDAGGWDIPLHHSYIWNCVSWDVQGIHTASALWNTDVDQGDWPVKNGFAVQEVIDMIKGHNSKTRSERTKRHSSGGHVAAKAPAPAPAPAPKSAASPPKSARNAAGHNGARVQAKANSQTRTNQPSKRRGPAHRATKAAATPKRS